MFTRFNLRHFPKKTLYLFLTNPQSNPPHLGHFPQIIPKQSRSWLASRQATHTWSAWKTQCCHLRLIMSCTVAILSLPVFSPSSRPLSYKATSASREPVVASLRSIPSCSARCSERRPSCLHHPARLYYSGGIDTKKDHKTTVVLNKT